jgi:DnaK suppressor protein
MTSHLTNAQRAKLKAELDRRLRALERQIATHQEGRSRTEHARDVLERDYDDAPQRAMDREVDMAMSDLDTQELAALARARKRSEGDEFGLCADCGAEITFDRLMAEPGAERCVLCETKHEQQDRKP